MRREEALTRIESRSFDVVYEGSDGVNLRDRPNGILHATLYDQSSSKFHKDPVADEKYIDGLPWIFGRIEGWMAIRNIERGYDYAVRNTEGSLTMIWDGDGDPNDNFISLRSSIDGGSRIAKMYRGAKLEIVDGNRRTIDGYQWIKVRLSGWAARKSPKGTTLLRER